MTVLPRLARRLLPSFAVFFAFSFLIGAVIAQNPPAAASSSTWSQDDALRISQEVQKRLGRLNNYGVFDWITFGFHGKSIVLQGYASRPTVKNEAGNVLKKIPGVESIDNQIQVLPLSNMDNRIRAEVYSHIYTQPALRIYNANQGSISEAVGPGGSSFMSRAAGRDAVRMSGGIVNYPPRGFHAIHIIVRNGNVILYGVVNSENDKAIAGIQANSTSGVFSVQNDLVVQGAK